MPLTFMTRFVASLLSSLLFVAILTQVFNHTLFSSKYLEGQLQHTNSYARLATTLSSEVSAEVGSTDPNLAGELQLVITPQAVQQKINPSLDQLQAYYQGKSTVSPVINLSDLSGQLQSAGLPLPADSTLRSPVQLGGAQKTKGIGTALHILSPLTLYGSLVLAIILLLLCTVRRRFGAWAAVFISVGGPFALVAIGFVLLPIIASKLFVNHGTSADFPSIFRDIFIAIARDLAKIFGIIAALFLAAGLGLRTWLRRRNRRQVETPPTAPTNVQSA